jgi:DNA-directed RNA polymerase specialized sigma24 family protein
VEPFTALSVDWGATSVGQPACLAAAAWGEVAPELAGFASPADLVAAINQPANASRSCALLAALLVCAGSDPQAGRAVLQAVTPGIRQAAAIRWRKAGASRPWRIADEIAVDAIRAAWEAIDANAGLRHVRPARVIVRHVEAALRTIHVRWIRETKSRVQLHQLPSERSLVTVAMPSPEEQAITLIAQAVDAGIIDRHGAVLLTMTGVIGYGSAEAARILELSYETVDLRLRRARQGMRAWLEVPAAAARREEVQAAPGNSFGSDLEPRRRGASRSTRPLRLLGDDSPQARLVPESPPRTPGSEHVTGSTINQIILDPASRTWRRQLGSQPWAAFEELALNAVVTDDGWTAAVGVRDLGATLGITKDTAARAIATLRAAGLVTVVRAADDNGRSRSGYRLNLPDGMSLRCLANEDSAQGDDGAFGHRDTGRLDGEYRRPGTRDRNGRRTAARRRPPRRPGSQAGTSGTPQQFRLFDNPAHPRD